MSATIVIRPLGPTYRMTVTSVAHSPISIIPSSNDNCNYAAFTNTGANDVIVTISQLSKTPIVPVFPLDGTPTTTDSFLIPHGMTGASVLAVPANGFNLAAIALGAGTTEMYITPVGDQS